MYWKPYHRRVNDTDDCIDGYEKNSVVYNNDGIKLFEYPPSAEPESFADDDPLLVSRNKYWYLVFKDIIQKYNPSGGLIKELKSDDITAFQGIIVTNKFIYILDGDDDIMMLDLDLHLIDTIHLPQVFNEYVLQIMRDCISLDAPVEPDTLIKICKLLSNGEKMGVSIFQVKFCDKFFFYPTPEYLVLIWVKDARLELIPHKFKFSIDLNKGNMYLPEKDIYKSYKNKMILSYDGISYIYESLGLSGKYRLWDDVPSKSVSLILSSHIKFFPKSLILILKYFNWIFKKFISHDVRSYISLIIAHSFLWNRKSEYILTD